MSNVEHEHADDTQRQHPRQRLRPPPRQRLHHHATPPPVSVVRRRLPMPMPIPVSPSILARLARRKVPFGAIRCGRTGRGSAGRTAEMADRRGRGCGRHVSVTGRGRAPGMVAACASASASVGTGGTGPADSHGRLEGCRWWWLNELRATGSHGHPGCSCCCGLLFVFGSTMELEAASHLR